MTAIDPHAHKHIIILIIITTCNVIRLIASRAKRNIDVLHNVIGELELYVARVVVVVVVVVVAVVAVIIPYVHFLLLQYA